MTPPKLSPRQVSWARRWMTLALFGLLAFLIGVEPNLIAMDRSPVVGFVQIGTWLTGLGFMLLGAYAAVRVIRNGRRNSLRADIGVRLISTGYVVAAAASLADFISIGSHQMPNIYFGPVQTLGLVAGVVTSVLGLLLYWPLAPWERSQAGGEQLSQPRSA